MSGSRASVKHVVVMIIAAALLGLAVSGGFVVLAASSDAAPYPPSEPCSVSATARGIAAEDGSTSWDVVGSGLGSTLPVRVVLAATGQELGTAETDAGGNFETVVTAPRDPDATEPDLTASSAQQTCTSTPPADPTPSASTAPGIPTSSSEPTRSTASTNQPSTPGGAGGPNPSDGPGGSGAPTNPGASGATTGGESTGATSPGSSTGPAGSSAAPTSTASSTPPLAEPLPGSDTPFGIGLGIAAVLLVLGTLAVLLLTRRPER